MVQVALLAVLTVFHAQLARFVNHVPLASSFLQVAALFAVIIVLNAHQLQSAHHALPDFQLFLMLVSLVLQLILPLQI